MGTVSPPLWVTLCDEVNEMSGDHRVSIQDLDFNLQFKWNPDSRKQVLFNITHWTNYGKFGLLNIHSGNNSFFGCEDGDIYNWNTSDWSFLSTTSNLIKSSIIMTDNICGAKYSTLILETSFDGVLNFQQLMGGSGRISQIDSWTHFASLVDIDIELIVDFGYWVSYKDINGSYTDIDTGNIFDENRWCEGQPNNVDHRCISCDFCCYDVACNGGASYVLLQIDSNTSLTLRYA